MIVEKVIKDFNVYPLSLFRRDSLEVTVPKPFADALDGSRHQTRLAKHAIWRSNRNSSYSVHAIALAPAAG